MEATSQFLRAFKQAPWRQQMQTLSGLSIGLMILLVLGGLYLAVASRAGNAGRDLQYYERRKVELAQENNRLRAQLADLRTMNRMAARALELGFVPAEPDEVEYVAVPDYPYPTAQAAPQSQLVAVAAQPRSLVDWLTRTLRNLAGGG
jgi:hypothetical protein